MGQALPLPQRIPMPNATLKGEMTKLGFSLDMSNSNQLYVTYRMPIGWSLYNYNERIDVPVYYFVDENNKVRFIISGNWTIYDHSLLISKVETPFVYTPKKGYVRPWYI